MARARNLKPSLFKNEVLGTADPLLTLLFESLWCLADKAGRLEDRPMRIKAETFPYRDGLDINGYLTELERLGFIHRYSVAGLALIEIVNFVKHQNPHHTEKESEYPAFTTVREITVKQPLDNGDAPADSLLPPTDSLNTDSLVSGAWGFPIQPLLDAFPNLELTPAQIGLIEADVKPEDAEAWTATIKLYRANHDPTLGRYLPDKVGNLLSVFRSKQAEVLKQNGKTVHTDKPSSEESAADIAKRIGANIL